MQVPARTRRRVLVVARSRCVPSGRVGNPRLLTLRNAKRSRGRSRVRPRAARGPQSACLEAVGCMRLFQTGDETKSERPAIHSRTHAHRYKQEHSYGSASRGSISPSRCWSIDELVTLRATASSLPLAWKEHGDLSWMSETPLTQRGPPPNEALIMQKSARSARRTGTGFFLPRCHLEFRGFWPLCRRLRVDLDGRALTS